MSKPFWASSPKPSLQCSLSDSQAHLHLVRLNILLASRTTVTFPTVLGSLLSVLPLPASSAKSPDTLLQMPHASTQKLPILCSTHKLGCSHSTLQGLFLCHRRPWTILAYLTPRIPFLPFLSSWKTVVDTLCLKPLPTQPSRQLLLINSLGWTLKLKTYAGPFFFKVLNWRHFHTARPRKWSHVKWTQQMATE